MKFRKLFTYLFLIIGTTNLHAQKKIGIYIHGFQGGSEKWSEVSLAPQKLIQDQVFDKYVTLSYETGELNPNGRLSLLNKFIDQIRNKACIPLNDGTCLYEEPDLQNDQFVLIGHSLGGLVARVLYPALINHPQDPEKNVNVVGVISIGGPMQGTGAANVTTSDVSAVFNSLENKLKDAWDVRSPIINEVLTKFIEDGEDIGDQLNLLPEYLITVRDSALGYVSETERLQAGLIIGREGEIIEEINSIDENNPLLHPQRYLSVIGSEKEKIPLRMAGQIFDIIELKSEEDVLDTYEQLEIYFNAHIVAYDLDYINAKATYITCLLIPFGGAFCDDSDYKLAEERRETWETAKMELERIDSYWGRLIDSFKLVLTTYQEYLPPCPDNSGDLPSPILDLQIPIETTCSSNPNGEWVTKTTYIKHADKSDGVVNIQSALWNADDGFDDLNNSYYPDVLLNDNGEDEGGFNHFELRNYERGYQLKKNGNIVFDVGDRAPQYDAIIPWLRDVLNN